MQYNNENVFGLAPLDTSPPLPQVPHLLRNNKPPPGLEASSIRASIIQISYDLSRVESKITGWESIVDQLRNKIEIL